MTIRAICTITFSILMSIEAELPIGVKRKLKPLREELSADGHFSATCTKQEGGLC